MDPIILTTLAAVASPLISLAGIWLRARLRARVDERKRRDLAVIVLTAARLPTGSMIHCRCADGTCLTMLVGGGRFWMSW